MTSGVRHIFERCITAEQEERLRTWAWHNAYMLVFAFVFMWALLIGLAVGVIQ